MAQRAAASRLAALPVRLLNVTDNIVLAPSGASYYSALMIAELARNVSPVPVFVSRGYDVPKWVGSRTLFVPVSSSGKDQELIYSIAAAGDQGANCVVISGGSHMHEIASAQGYPEYALGEEEDHPALEIAGSFAVLWSVLSGLTGLREGDIDSLQPILTRQRDLMSDGGDNNPASLIAGALKGKSAHFYGSSGICATAAQVWSNVLHRATGSPAIYGQFPGVDDGLAPVNYGMDLTGDAVVLLIRDASDDDILRERIDHWVKIATEGALSGRLHEIIAEGASPLERLWSTVHLGMWTACWAAM